MGGGVLRTHETTPKTKVPTPSYLDSKESKDSQSNSLPLHFPSLFFVRNVRKQPNMGYSLQTFGHRTQKEHFQGESSEPLHPPPSDEAAKRCDKCR